MRARIQSIFVVTVRFRPHTDAVRKSWPVELLDDVGCREEVIDRIVRRGTSLESTRTHIDRHLQPSRCSLLEDGRAFQMCHVNLQEWLQSLSHFECWCVPHAFSQLELFEAVKFDLRQVLEGCPRWAEMLPSDLHETNGQRYLT